MQQMTSAGTSCQHLLRAHLTLPLFTLLSHHKHLTKKSTTHNPTNPITPASTCHQNRFWVGSIMQQECAELGRMSNHPAASLSAVMLIRRPNKTTGKTKSFPQSCKMISPPIDAPADSDIMPAPRRKTLVRKRTMTKQQTESMICTIISNESGVVIIQGMSDSQIGFYLEMMGFDATSENIKKIRTMDAGE
jgi:hypothetical protein